MTQLQMDGDRDGATFEAAFDRARLNKQHRSIAAIMRDGQWYTLEGLSMVTGYPPASISARIRDFRKPRFGGCQVDRRRVAGGLYEYRLVVPR